MKHKVLYVLHGLEFEYSLSPLATYLRQIHKEVFELNTGEKGQLNLLLSKTPNHKIVYITSWHLWFDSHNYNSIYSQRDEIISPLELMSILEPEFSIFYPHDLSCFFHESEVKWLDLFDLILLPYRNNQFYHLLSLELPVHEIGWIKQKNMISYNKNIDGYSPVYFPSNYPSGIKLFGSKAYAEYYNTYVPKEIPLKFAPYKDAIDFKNYLVEYGFQLLPETLSINDILDKHNLIIGNGDSSIIYEAALSGIPVITLLDGFSTDETYLESFASFASVQCIHYDDLASYLSSLNLTKQTLPLDPPVLKPFDYKKLNTMLPKSIQIM